MKCETQFAKAGFLSRMSFWWLNPLMKKGKKKKLEDDDIPILRKIDRAESCYLLFTEQLKKQKQIKPSIARVIVLCYWKEILISGLFAFLKVITLSSAPLFLGAFISVWEGKEASKHEGYMLAILLFLTKFIESLSQRQWYFRCRLLGVQVRSLLSASIYRKQLRLSNGVKSKHSAGEIINLVTVDCYRVGEFPYWLHHIWTSCLQLCLGLAILYRTVGFVSVASLVVILLSLLCNTPLAKLQQKFQSKLIVAQDKRLKAISEAILNMKVLKLYAWEMSFKSVIERLRKEELKVLKVTQLLMGYTVFPLNATNVFTFVATLRIVQEPIRLTPEIIAMIIHVKVAFRRIVEFLAAPELECKEVRKLERTKQDKYAIYISSANLSWEDNSSILNLKSIDLEVKVGEKVAICGEVGAGKSTLLAALLGEIPKLEGTVQVNGKIAYVSQMAWIQSGSIQANILFGSPMDKQRYQETIEKCSLVKDLDMLPFGDQTEIGERGINLSGGQKQRIQLARALYQDADIYLLDDPFSAVDAHTAINIFNEYIMGALSEKTVVLVTHQVDFLPSFDSILLMSGGQIQHAASYQILLSSSRAFRELVHAHKATTTSERPHIQLVTSSGECETYSGKTRESYCGNQLNESVEHQLIEQEERETRDTAGLKPYIQYLNQNKSFIYFSVAVLSQIIFFVGQVLQNYWMAANVHNPHVTQLRLILVYILIGCSSMFFVLFRSLSTVALGIISSKSLFDQLLKSLFHAPVSFYESTPLGRILSRVSSDLSIVDLDLPSTFVVAAMSSANTCFNLGVVAVITWQVLVVSIPLVYMVILLQRYYSASAKEFMRMSGTTKSMLASHLGESIAGAMTIRAFEQENRFFTENLDLIDKNCGPSFHIFSANEWLIQRLETLCSIILCCSALVIVLLPTKIFGSGFIGMALSYGLSLNHFLVVAVQNKCTLANYMVSLERLNQYMHILSEAPELIEGNRPMPSWPAIGRVEIHDLKMRYRLNTPIVLQGISCIFEGGHKIGIVGRTGSGKSTLIGALFRLVEPVGGKIIIDGIDISTIGLHDLRSRLGIIPQDPTLFNGTVRYNLDPLSQHVDEEIWEVLDKCQLRQIVKVADEGLDSSVQQDGVNWSMGQRQLFCLGRSLLRRSQILVLDEATASIDSATDYILQKTIRTEFENCTVITVAHRIPTVMDSTMVLGLSDGKIVEYDEPVKLIADEGSLFGQLVKEYWSHSHTAY
ncbi:ABC transporter C family member 10-like [Papaver somniferum]|uniref:ABC transporter C family member 10-like n=1 Tax=Papaver somniferum TaxID=3469 RepID=UPI000E6F96A6|nr:ABC transporter C family member 10-like [Papaver somniferum]